MLLSELLDTLDEKKVEGFRDLELPGLAYDSRLVEPWEAFFCIKGLVTDGHLYAADAVGKGAAVLFIEKELEAEVGEEVILVKVPDTRRAMARCSARFFGDPSGELKLVGVTGTNGKTTTTFLVESICRKAGHRTGIIGTVETHIGSVVEPVTRTTPESLDLQRLLRRMADDGVEVVAMEVSSHALELERVDGCRFEVVVFTNLTQDHLDFHISIEEYFGAKRRLFTGDRFGPGRRALANIDDQFGRRLMEETELGSRSFGLGREADIRGTGVEVSQGGNRFVLEYAGESIPLLTALQGRFNVYNCLAAAGVAFELGIGTGNIVQGLETMKGVPGRFENIDCGQDFTVIVDYAHTPDGIRSLLEACREVTSGRVILVIGCGGDRDRSKRPLMGKVGAEMSNLCIITSDNPRSEDPQAIIEMILDGIRESFSPERYMVEVDRRSAIYKAIGEAAPGDLVVVAGKGHESGQIFAERVIPFDDRQVVREGLKEVAGAEY
ncbi:MAG: UDP-N-acetylmuramoyl-L-alanyl-D-glutamate--2,6-diaminopimelate ligase [Actinobacteria bacterium]|nr:UDP-N-acetylmuramoyl-L-alanyl-D-glutamate--2,6-diaminopimelate ligase [Actinomycetota bacterium]